MSAAGGTATKLKARAVAIAAALALAPVAAHAQQQFRGSKAAEALGDHIVVEELAADLDGTGEPEAIVIEGELGQGPDPETLWLSFWRYDAKKGWQLLNRSKPYPGTRVGIFERRSLGCGNDPVLLAEMVDERPDEARRSLLIAGDGKKPEIRQVIDSQAGYRAPDLLDASFATRPLGFSVQGKSLVLDADPTLVDLQGPEGEARQALVGLRRTTYECRDGRFAAVGSTYVDLLQKKGGPTGPAGDGSLQTGLLPAKGATLELDATAGVRALRVIPGCAASQAAWKQAGEVKKMRLDGLPGGPVALDLSSKTPATGEGLVGAAVLPLSGAGWGRQLLVVFADPLPAGKLSLSVTGTEKQGGCLSEVVLY